MIRVYYIDVDQPWAEADYTKALNLLPNHEKQKNQKFIRWQDRQLGASGKLLLKFGLKEMGLDQSLEQLMIGKNGKPYFDHGPHFNISHSGKYAVCAISTIGELGIDIEEMKTMPFEDFKSVFTQREWHLIEKNNYSAPTFYEFWTKKEAVIKADGEGLSIPLSKINAISDTIECQDRTWITQSLEIDAHYKSYLASAVITECMLNKIEDFSLLIQDI